MTLIYRKIKTEYLKKTVLTIAMDLKLMNDKIVPGDLVPSSLDFGKYPDLYKKAEAKNMSPFVEERCGIT